MNVVIIEPIESTVNVENTICIAEVKLIPVETIQYGFMGLQAYEGVDPVADDKKG